MQSLMLLMKITSIQHKIMHNEFHRIVMICVISGIIVSTLNTLVFYADAKIFHYYEYHMIFGVFWIRIASGVISSLLMAIVALPVVAALKRANFIPNKKARV